MAFPVESNLKRSQPCMDLISMTSSETSDTHRDSACSTSDDENLKKRSASLFPGWDHYKSDDDGQILLEYQEWRNKKRSRRADTCYPSMAATRMKVARHNNGVSSMILEDGTVDSLANPRIPSTIYCTSKCFHRIHDDYHNGSAIPGANQITHDLAMI
mmetsp:Transcript_17025/g.32217  ORF Transcript_17025/g.32217 Transcript_17025/m.32217 type:complete len:158 (+) Transcript_17025:150-623(+)